MRSTFDQALRLHGVSVREDTAHAAHFLEGLGFQYGKDFKVADAIEAAGAAILELEAEGVDAAAAVVSGLRKPMARATKMLR
jgi:hypothetical protein